MRKTRLAIWLFVFLASVFGGVLHADPLSTLAGALSGTVLAGHFYRRLWPDR
ncbi:MAG: hypothetical protein KIT09_16085 [Bryobacteraceae bacterium]|nr:hypothetical protein [Bryobacteraceae bacterium]